VCAIIQRVLVREFGDWGGGQGQSENVDKKTTNKQPFQTLQRLALLAAHAHLARRSAEPEGEPSKKELADEDPEGHVLGGVLLGVRVLVVHDHRSGDPAPPAPYEDCSDHQHLQSETGGDCQVCKGVGRVEVMMLLVEILGEAERGRETEGEEAGED
jgi:hypothetical protein